MKRGRDEPPRLCGGRIFPQKRKNSPCSSLLWLRFQALYVQALCPRTLRLQSVFQIRKIRRPRLQKEGMKAQIGILILPQFLRVFLQRKNLQITEIIL